MRTRGFTLPELTAITAVVGILATVSTAGVGKLIDGAHRTEATANLGAIAREAAAAYEQTSPDGFVGPGQTSAPHRLCASEPGTVPRSLESVHNGAYQSSPGEWNAAPGAGFGCLGFRISTPQRFAYAYERQGDGHKPGDGFRASAYGETRTGGAIARISLNGKILAVGAGLAAATAVEETTVPRTSVPDAPQGGGGGKTRPD